VTAKPAPAIRHWGQGRFWRRFPVAGLFGLALLAGCAPVVETVTVTLPDQNNVRSGSAAPVSPPEKTAAVTPAPHYKVGNPYQIDGKWYYPAVDYSYVEQGIASWYGPKFHGRLTANGETFDMNQVSAAHRTLPLPSMAKVTNLENGKVLELRINDRGPYARNRIIDLSRRAAELLGFLEQGTAPVRVEILEPESRRLAALMQEQPLPLAAIAQPPVNGEKLDPPAGALVSPAREITPALRAVPGEAPGPDPVAIPAAGAVSGYTTVDVPVAATLYVQVGAYSRYDSALRVRAQLSGLAPDRIDQLQSTPNPLFRVRLGPLATVGDADELNSIIGEYYNLDSQVVIDTGETVQ